ncbi:MAG: hypothetical protein ACLQFW_21675, partial [Xanthobacteraceae bacterium]
MSLASPPPIQPHAKNTKTTASTAAAAPTRDKRSDAPIPVGKRHHRSSIALISIIMATATLGTRGRCYRAASVAQDGDEYDFKPVKPN